MLSSPSTLSGSTFEQSLVRKSECTKHSQNAHNCLSGSFVREIFSTPEFTKHCLTTPNMKLAKSWLHLCSTQHSLCHRKVNPEGLPTRLLDISTSPIKLIRTSTVCIDQYATLSYKWGTQPQLLTTLEDLSTHEIGIQWPEMSKTTKDAITVTRELGLKYLFIDALCILQNCPSDKLREVLKMASIYRNAAVTIVAQAAESAHEGFAVSPKWPPIDLTIPFGLPDNPGILLLRREENLTHIADYNIEATETRAWCLQESLLSRATLVFGSMHMYWACCEVFYADSTGTYTSNSTLPPHVHHISPKLPPLLLQQTPNVALTPSSRAEIWSFWTHIINLYGSRHLTYFTDRFDALSAIVSSIQTLTRDTYIAGLWSSEMIPGLLWVVDPIPTSSSKTHFPRPSQSNPSERLPYIAPTWSWFSVLGSVTHRPFPPALDFKILTYDIQLSNPEQPLGRLLDGTITVRGRLNIAVWARKRRTTNKGNGGLWRLELPSMWSAKQVIAENRRIDKGRARNGAHGWNGGMGLASGFGAFERSGFGRGGASSPFGATSSGTSRSGSSPFGVSSFGASPFGTSQFAMPSFVDRNNPHPQPYGPSNPPPAYQIPLFPPQEQGQSWADTDGYIDSR
jgi:hypothetical protein